MRRRLQKIPRSILEVAVARQVLRRLDDLVALVPSGVAVRQVDDRELRRLTGSTAHQGVAARTLPFAYADLETVLASAPNLVVVLDQVQDPHNLGAVLRTAAGVGAAAVVIPLHGAVGITPAVEKVAAGAAAELPVSQVVNVARTLERLEEHGFWSIGLEPKAEVSLYSCPIPPRVAVVLGGEKGLRPLVARACDTLVAIPMASAIESLNASVAAAVALYDIRHRQPPPA